MRKMQKRVKEGETFSTTNDDIIHGDYGSIIEAKKNSRVHAWFGSTVNAHKDSKVIQHAGAIVNDFGGEIISHMKQDQFK